MHRLPFLFMLLMVACAVQAEAPSAPGIYRWSTPDGRVHFSDRPGAAAATPHVLSPDGISIVEGPSGPPRRNPLQAVLDRERAWAEENRRRDRQRALAEIEQRERACSTLRSQIAAAEQRRQRARLRTLEEQWYSRCR